MVCMLTFTGDIQCILILSCLVAMERKFTLRQKLCYTAMVKFAVTNSMWSINKCKKKKKPKEDYNPLDVTHTCGIGEDERTLYYEKMMRYIKTSPVYDQESPYVKNKWYVHVEDPNYKPQFPKKPWDPSDKVDWAPRKTTLGHEQDPRLEETRRRKQDAKRRAALRQKQKEAEEAAEAVEAAEAAAAADAEEAEDALGPLQSSIHRSSQHSSSHRPSQSSLSRRSSQSPHVEVSEPPEPYEEPTEVASHSPAKSMNYYRKTSMTYYKHNRDIRNPTVRQMLVGDVRLCHLR